MHIAGISPQESWCYTWGEGLEAVDAYQQRENARAKKQAVALYNAAVFLAGLIGGKVQTFAQAFPGFDESSDKEPKQMSDDAMYAMVRSLNAQFGGKEDD